MSTQFWSAWPGRVRYTPSTKTPTAPSNERLLPVVPMPRMRMLALLAALLVTSKLMLGDTAWMSVMFSTRASASISADAAVTAMGTSCRFCSRRWAVTTISSIAGACAVATSGWAGSDSVSSTGLDSGSVCARAPVVSSSAALSAPVRTAADAALIVGIISSCSSSLLLVVLFFP